MEGLSERMHVFTSTRESRLGPRPIRPSRNQLEVATSNNTPTAKGVALDHRLETAARLIPFFCDALGAIDHRCDLAA